VRGAARRLLGCSAALALSLAALPALANGRFPATNQLVVMPGKPTQLMVRSTFGLLVSSDQGKNWDWICEQAALGPNGAAGTEDPGVALTASGAIIVAASEGLIVSPDTGCSWVNADPTFFVDVAVRPNAPHEAIALEAMFDGEGSTESFRNQLYVTTDDGAHWTPYGVPLDPTFIGDTVEVSASDPNRVYVTGEKSTSTEMAALFTSTNGGATWTENPVPILPQNEEAAFIAAVDPTNPDRVYLRTGDHTGLQASRLLVTDNAGMTFTERYAGTGPMQGFALSPDGSTVYIGFGRAATDGDVSDGLQVASTTNFAFKQRSNVIVQCLALSGATLYACAPELSGFVLGASTDDGATFKTLLHLCDIRGPLACGSSTTDTKVDCTSFWSGSDSLPGQGVAEQLGDPCSTPPDAGEPSADGGPSPPAPDAGKTAGTPASTGAGCATAPKSGDWYGWYGVGAGVLVSAALMWGRRKRRGP